MNIITDKGFTGLQHEHPMATKYMVLGHADSSLSVIPKGFFRTWYDEEPGFGHFAIGRGSWLGLGSIAKYDSEQQKLSIGHYVAGGQRLRFILNGQHEIRTISTAMFSMIATGVTSPVVPQYGDTTVGHDVWIGDEAMILGGSAIANGCVIGARALIPPNFKSEPFGIYVGTPVRLVRFRFSEKIREALIALAWWDMPLEWIGRHNAAFLVDMTQDEGKALETLAALAEEKARNY